MSNHVIRKTCACSACVALPLKHNQYRPYVLRHPMLAMVSAFLVTTKLASILLTILTPQTAYLATISAPYLVDRTNQARAEAGLPPLSVNSLLQESARRKAEDMFKYNYFAHNSPQGVTPWQWFDGVGYAYVYAGENLAIDFQTGEGVHKAWMDSPGHRKNILSDRYREIGIAVVTGNFDGRTTTIVVQHFGSLSSAPVTQQPPASVPEEPSLSPTPTPVPPTPAPTPAPTPRPPQITPTPEPLPAPIIIEPEEGMLLPSGAATVRGTAVRDSDVHVTMDEELIGMWPTVDGVFHGTFTPPPNAEQESTLIATAKKDGRTSPPSKPRRVTIQTKTPTAVADEAFFLPDPGGDVTSLLLIVPVLGNVAEATADIGRTRVPMAIQGNVASAQVSKQTLGYEFQVYIEDIHGNTGVVSLQPTRTFHDTQRAESEQRTRQKVQSFMSSFQTVAFWILVVITIILTITILFRLRAENIDLAAHAIFVVILGVALLLLT